jgi:hypothetical protein
MSKCCPLCLESGLRPAPDGGAKADIAAGPSRANRVLTHRSKYFCCDDLVGDRLSGGRECDSRYTPLPAGYPRCPPGRSVSNMPRSNRRWPQ